MAFSRNTIFGLKAKIEYHKGSHCAVVYGGLPSGEECISGQGYQFLLVPSL